MARCRRGSCLTECGHSDRTAGNLRRGSHVELQRLSSSCCWTTSNSNLTRKTADTLVRLRLWVGPTKRFRAQPPSLALALPANDHASTPPRNTVTVFLGLAKPLNYLISRCSSVCTGPETLESPRPRRSSHSYYVSFRYIEEPRTGAPSGRGCCLPIYGASCTSPNITVAGLRQLRCSRIWRQDAMSHGSRYRTKH